MYKHALAAVESLVLESLKGPGTTPLSRLDEAAVDMANAAWEAGARIGHVLGQAQLQLEVAEQICLTCHGYGTHATLRIARV